MSNYVLRKVESVKIGPYGADEAACTDLGSVRELTLKVSQEIDEATSTIANGAVVAAQLSAAKAEIALALEEVTSENLAYATGGAVDGTNVDNDGGGGAPVYLTLYAHGFAMDGSAVKLHVVKCMVKPETEIKLGKEQMILDLSLVAMYDPDSALGYKLFRFSPDAADTTAPTVSSTTPANAATGVARSSALVVTFSEAVRTEDVNGQTIFVAKADGSAVVAGTLSAVAEVVTFTPSAQLAATTEYAISIAAGIRDVAGNALAAPKLVVFTTGS